MEVRRLVALVIAVIGFGLAVFGVARGVSNAGPASGTRVIVQISSPVDDDARAIAEHVVRARIEDVEGSRVVVVGDQLVAEVPYDADRELDALLQRAAKLEVRDGETTVLDGRGVKRAAVTDGGVAITVGDASRIKPNTPLAFVLDGKPRTTLTADRVSPTEVHVIVPTVDAAIQLVAMIEAGAVRPLVVLHREAFTRATGFLPRAWPFFAIAGLFLAVAAVLGLRRGST